MLRNILIFVFTFFLLSNVFAQLTLTSLSDSEMSIEELVVQDLVGCSTVSVSNVEYIGSTNSIGTFNYLDNNGICSDGFGLSRGILMTNGDVQYAVGPNNDGDDGANYNTQYNNDFIESYLLDHEVVVSGVELYDACILEFDLTSSFPTEILFDVIYGSEEYTEWMSPWYSDAFCFFVSEVNGDYDPNFDSVPKNIMETGSIINQQCEILNKPISAWTIRPYSNQFNLPAVNECLYLDNQDGDYCDAIGYDGFTTPMEFSFSLVPEATYNVLIIISDGGYGNSGGGLDSGVFIKNSTITISPDVNFIWDLPQYTDDGAIVSFFNTSSIYDANNILYSWDFNNDGISDSSELNPVFTFNQSGYHIVTLEIIDSCSGEISSVSYDLFINNPYDTTSLAESANDVIISSNYVDKSISIQHNFNSNYLFQIIDNFGKLILSKSLSSNESLIDLKNIDSGCYFVRIISENKSRIYNKKIIVI